MERVKYSKLCTKSTDCDLLLLQLLSLVHSCTVRMYNLTSCMHVFGAVEYLCSLTLYFICI